MWGVLDSGPGSRIKRPGWIVQEFGRWPQWDLVTGCGGEKERRSSDSMVFDLNSRVDSRAVSGDGGLGGKRVLRERIRRCF